MPLLPKKNCMMRFWIIVSVQAVSFRNWGPERVVSALKLVEIENMTPKKTLSNHRKINKLSIKRALNELFLISKWSIFQLEQSLFSPRDENIKAKVVDNRPIEYNEEITSLSSSAQKYLIHYGIKELLIGRVEGETLDERRKRFGRIRLIFLEAKKQKNNF